MPVLMNKGADPRQAAWLFYTDHATLDGLGALNQPYVRLDFTHASKPAVLTGMDSIGGTEDSSFRYLLMPIRFGA